MSCFYEKFLPRLSSLLSAAAAVAAAAAAAAAAPAAAAEAPAAAVLPLLAEQVLAEFPQLGGGRGAVQTL